MSESVTIPAGAPQPLTKPIPARTHAGTNWVGAFLLYAKGASLQEVSDQLKIDFKKVKTKARTEDWETLVRLNQQLALRAPTPDVSPMSMVQLKDAQKRIEANREAALGVAQDLRGQIRKVLDAYSSAELFLQPQEIATLAKAAALVDQSSMMALGDDPAPKLAPADGAVKAPVNTGPVTHFHIHPPAAAMAPRMQKQVEQEPAVTGVKQVDALMGGRIEMAPTGNATEDDPAVTVRKLSSVDFKKLGAQVGAIVLPEPAKKIIPEFARVG
jgi:hypothetical protein